jgi:hypothetical protein
VAIFDNDDHSYLTWVSNFPESFVANALRAPNSNYFVIHKSTCSTINGTEKDYIEDSFTRNYYNKIYTHNYQKLIDWAQTNRVRRNPIKNCGTCKPQPLVLDYDK